MCLLKEFGIREQKTIKVDVFGGNVEQNQKHFTITRTDLDLQYG